MATFSLVSLEWPDSKTGCTSSSSTVGLFQFYRLADITGVLMLPAGVDFCLWGHHAVDDEALHVGTEGVGCRDASPPRILLLIFI